MQKTIDNVLSSISLSLPRGLWCPQGPPQSDWQPIRVATSTDISPVREDSTANDVVIAALLASGDFGAREDGEWSGNQLIFRPGNQAPSSTAAPQSPPAVDDTADDAVMAALVAEQFSREGSYEFQPDSPDPPRESRLRESSRTPRDSAPTDNDAMIAALLAEQLERENTESQRDAALAARLAEEWDARRMTPARPSLATAATASRIVIDESGWDAHQAREESCAAPGQEACVACLDKAANTLLVPCGHVNLCVGCAGQLNPPRCPVCRMTVERGVRIQPRRAT